MLSNSPAKASRILVARTPSPSPTSRSSRSPQSFIIPTSSPSLAPAGDGTDAPATQSHFSPQAIIISSSSPLLAPADDDEAESNKRRAAKEGNEIAFRCPVGRRLPTQDSKLTRYFLRSRGVDVIALEGDLGTDLTSLVQSVNKYRTDNEKQLFKEWVPEHSRFRWPVVFQESGGGTTAPCQLRVAT